MPVTRIGIIYVHGIGEQRRFEHLDSQIRPLMDAVRRVVQGTDFTVEIVGGQASTLHADQDTWASQPVRAIVRQGDDETHIHFHEVWWADVNESYSFKKEYRFWAWALAVWAIPGKPGSNLPGAASLRLPAFPNGGLTRRQLIVARLKLLAASNVFLMGAFSIGALTYVAKRVLDYSAPNVVRVFVNYVSSVRLYTQKTREGGGFLDAYREPPRVSIRRRMIRALIDVAAADYDRWYVFAHSLGSVVAHNGIMESGHALPNYLDEARWTTARIGGFGGDARERDRVGKTNDMMPARPVWLRRRDVIYRDVLFRNFRGLLTYGSPLDKFAAIWPARVPINDEAVFRDDADWINVYDPTDPVGASLDAFGSSTTTPAGVIYPQNYGYRAHWALLYSHLCYLRVNGNEHDLSRDLTTWVLSGVRFANISGNTNAPYFAPGSATDRRRTAWALTMWLIVYILLTAAAMFTVPFILKALKELAQKALDILAQIPPLLHGLAVQTGQAVTKVKGWLP